MLKKGKKFRILRFTAGYGPLNYSIFFFIFFFWKLHDQMNTTVFSFSKSVKKWIFGILYRKISFFQKVVSKICSHEFWFQIFFKKIFYGIKYQKLIFWPILKTKKPLYSSDCVVFKKKKKKKNVEKCRVLSRKMSSSVWKIVDVCRIMSSFVEVADGGDLLPQATLAFFCKFDKISCFEIFMPPKTGLLNAP